VLVGAVFDKQRVRAAEIIRRDDIECEAA